VEIRSSGDPVTSRSPWVCRWKQQRCGAQSVSRRGGGLGARSRLVHTHSSWRARRLLFLTDRLQSSRLWPCGFEHEYRPHVARRGVRMGGIVASGASPHSRISAPRPCRCTDPSRENSGRLPPSGTRRRDSLGVLHTISTKEEECAAGRVRASHIPSLGRECEWWPRQRPFKLRAPWQQHTRPNLRRAPVTRSLTRTQV
jgi:hypothetical protein